jgi:alanine dehydrogenase
MAAGRRQTIARLVENQRVLVLNRRQVEELLDLEALVDALAVAMVDVSAGRASLPPRGAALVDERDGFLASMPAYLPSLDVLSAKLVSLFPRNARGELPTHQAVIAVFDPETGSPVALLDGAYITAARTAAGSALSARLLAREDASVLAVVGTGVQAQAHARAIPRVRGLAEIRLSGRNAERTRAVAEALAKELGLPVRPMASPAEALDGADIVCACTHSAEPVVRREWLSPIVHVTSVGYGGRELDDATVADALVVVESRAAALAPFPSGSADLTEPIAAGLLDPAGIREIGELADGSGDEQITVYKSVGIAAQDAAAAALVLAAARERGVGTEIDL